MKVECSEPAFKPVTITLETQHELDMLWSVLQGSPYTCLAEVELRDELFNLGAQDIRDKLKRAS